MKKILAPVLASAMLFGTTVAHAETRPEASRFSQPVTESASDLEGENGILLAILAAAAIIAGIIIIADDDGNSPN